MESSDKHAKFNPNVIQHLTEDRYQCHVDKSIPLRTIHDSDKQQYIQQHNELQWPGKINFHCSWYRSGQNH